MKGLAFGLAGVILSCVLLGAQEPRERVPQGVRSAMEKQRAPTAPPLFNPQVNSDPAELKREAEELAKLSDSIPQEIEQVGKGLHPKELSEKLKRIEKLCKRLRSQITP